MASFRETAKKNPRYTANDRMIDLSRLFQNLHETVFMRFFRPFRCMTALDAFTIARRIDRREALHIFRDLPMLAPPFMRIQ
jgi:hypothetical protein